LKVVPAGSKSYARPITSAPDGGGGGEVTDVMLICCNGVPFAVKPTVPGLIVRLVRPSADVSVIISVKIP